MAAVMAVVHEHVHQWASKERQPDEQSEHMCPVLGEQQRAGDNQESNEHQSGLGFHGHALLRVFLVARMILHRHRRSPFESEVTLNHSTMRQLTQIKKMRWVSLGERLLKATQRPACRGTSPS